MNEDLEYALKTDSLIDITTVGGRTGRPHRIEIVFHNINGALYISGFPGRRDWYANLLANPRFTFHLKQSHHQDLPARAVPITRETARRQILSEIVAKWRRLDKLEEFVEQCPLVEIELEGI